MWKYRSVNDYASARSYPLIITRLIDHILASNMASSSHRDEPQDVTINTSPRSISHPSDAEQHQGATEKQDAIEVALDLQSSIAPSRIGGDKPVPQQTAGWFHWHEPDTSPEEKKLVFKLEWFLLSFSCLCFFVKQLDQNNVSNAYVSGMKEDLGSGPGNELS